ncbi:MULTISPECIES: TetR/AcrR family transcriptional regulator [Sphingomonadales]|uniref:Bacterial regulatory protein, tetR family n=1 Tax=Edaphosphingomonas haloaromaticamans TaxID=653954 RepID=A0A1S1HH69_9SPHN|nr:MULTISPECIES: TetR/AcrR family transcriptional regulator [Sphingomonas]AGH48998.1 TetR family transcriptional regulator [Sphingomonas sp. MM-1]OHT21417.1 Bacterial regulatory protein, tetR family [Sphingomonas haloaromaticamans]
MTASPPPAPSRGRGRPRKPETDATIIAAGRRLLREGGIDALTFDAIAQVTGVTRATIYRRWPTKAHLLSSIANEDGGDEVHFVDVTEEEGMAGEVRALIEQSYRRYCLPDISAASLGLFAAIQRDPALRRELQLPIETAARADMRRIVNEGKAKGMVRADVDPDAFFDVTIGAVLSRMLMSSVSADENLIDDITGIILNGIAPRD